MLFTASCVCEECMYTWNQEYEHEDDVFCPNCESDYVSFENVEEVAQ